MDYNFNCQIAQRYGVEEAVFLHNLYWWIRKNEANGRHHYDGKSWTYSSTDGFAKLFPFWTRRQIERIIRNLNNNGAIHIGNYNKSPYDRTRWYALSQEVVSIYAKGEMETQECVNDNSPNREIQTREHVNDNSPNREMTIHQTVQPIPDSKPDSKPDINTDSKPDICREVIAYLNEKAGTRYKATISKTQSFIRARTNEGFTLEDFKRVIDTKCAEWGREPKEGGKDMRPYLRPETLFGTKFESYLNQSPPLGVHREGDPPVQPPNWLDSADVSIEELLGVDFGDG